MASENRATPSPLILLRRLQQAPYSFGFFEALRQIECAYPEKARIGTSNRPVEDPVRFGQEPSLTFAPSTLSSLELSEQGFSPRLNVLFLGLFGPNGPLPLHLTEYARARMHNEGDATLSRFADMFHHRLLSLFYRVWADAEPVVGLDRLDDDRFSGMVATQLGIGTPMLRNRDAMPDFAKLYFAGRLSSQTKNAEGLLAVLHYYFHIPVTLTEFVGEWLNIPADSQMRLGMSRQTCSLGETTTLGERVWECQHKFRLTLGPLSMSDYQRMLPGGTSLTKLIAVVRNYVGDEYNWDLCLILEKSEVKPTLLGEYGQLGWTTWLSGKTPDHDREDLYLNPMLGLI
ncbi:MAG: type VI secretion system baseplate subunit TssG [Gammaproteobacteria bacterium]